jgi:hypothetical protein
MDGAPNLRSNSTYAMPVFIPAGSSYVLADSEGSANCGAIGETAGTAVRATLDLAWAVAECGFFPAVSNVPSSFLRTPSIAPAAPFADPAAVAAPPEVTACSIIA